MGAPRIVPTRGIPYPTGDPSLDPGAEKAWRRRLLEKALEAVSTAVSSPTIFEVGAQGAPTPSEREEPGPSGPSEQAEEEAARA